MMPSLTPPPLPEDATSMEDGDDEKVLQVMHAMATKWQSAGELHNAVGGFRAILESRRDDDTKLCSKTLHAIGNLAAVLRQTGQLAEAEELAREQVAGTARLLGSAHPDTLGATSNLVQVLSEAGKQDEAEPICTELLEASRQTLGAAHEATLIAQSALAQVYLAQGRHDAAEPLVRDDLASSTVVHGSRHSDTLVALSNLANVLTVQHKLTEAEPLMRQHVALCREVHGVRHPHTLVAIHNLVELLRRQGGAEAEAEPLLREQSEASARVLGPDHPDTVDASESLAALLVHVGRLPEALQIVHGLHGEAHAWTLSLTSKLVHSLCDADRPQDAEPYARQLVGATLRSLGAQSSASKRSRELLAAVLAKQRRAAIDHAHEPQHAEAQHEQQGY